MRRVLRLATLVVAIISVPWAMAAPGGNELVSVDSAESQANADSLTSFDVSAGGRWVAFVSFASNLVSGDTNGRADAFVRDRLTGTTERVSLSSLGAEANDAVINLAMDDDGRYVAFTSYATNLAPGDVDTEADVFVRDRQSGTTTRIGFSALDEIDISADGRYVVYNSLSSNIVPGDTNDGPDVFVHDRLLGTTERASIDSAGNQAEVAGNAYALQNLNAAISGDGNVVQFMSNATNLVANDTNGSWDTFVHDRTAGTTERVTVDSNENESHDPTNPANQVPSDLGSLSFDGRYSTYVSHADDLVPSDPHGGQDVFVRDRVAGTTEVVSIGDAPGGPAAAPASINADGRYVVFWSCFAVTTTDTNSRCDVYRHDRSSATTELVSIPVTDPPDGDSLFAYVDATGRYVAFLSFATNMVAGDTNGFLDLFVRDMVEDAVGPVVGPPTFSVNPKAVNESTVVSATAVDEGSGVVGGEYFIDVDPGEGNGTPMTLSGSTLSATIGTSLSPGVYSVCVRAEDGAGNWSAVSCAFLVVYDPTGGYATGGGWLVPGSSTSDPGDLLPGLDGTSKANFGFVVKYQSGSATVPGGNLEFHYNVGRFHLSSTEMEWLVVTNANWAKFQGTATISGASGVYPFRVDARDTDKLGQPDRFVIKIWAPGADPDATSPIYKASGDVLGGQVVIHR